VDLQTVDPANVERVGSWDVYSWPELGEVRGWIALRIPLPVEPGTPYLKNGWQSWSPTGESRLGGSVVRAPVGAVLLHPIAEPSYDGDESYDVLAADGFVAGFVEGGGILVARPRQRELLAIREGHGPHPAIWAAQGDRATLVDDLLTRIHGRVPERMPLGWCSWYGRFADISEDAIAADLEEASAVSDVLDVFQVDDGYQRAVGDWRDTNERFPSGLSALAHRIAKAGFTPAVWTAPFLVAPDSRLAAERPDWILRDSSGLALPAMWNPHWGGVVHALDVSRPDVLDWIEGLFRDLVAFGFRYLKLDFLYAAALTGAPARPMTGEQRLRAALAAIRRGAGEDAFLVGCGCPLWPAIGICDAMRIGPDVAPYWSAGDDDAGEPWSKPSLENAWRAAVARSPFHRRLWLNDPDCVMLRRRTTELTLEQSRAWVRWVAESGQLLVFSDRFEDLDREDLELWRELAAGRRAFGRR